jgi:hypothetical protein
VVNTSLSSSLYTPTSDLPRDKDLYWHVQAKGANPSAWSTTFTFHSANPPAIPASKNPTNNSVVLINPPILQWSAIYGADHYQLQVASASSFSDASLVYFQAVTSSTAPPTKSLPLPLTPNRTFSWRVRSVNASGQYSLWSSALSFHLSLPAPTLNLPDDGDYDISQRPTFSWNPVNEATSYILQVSYSDDFRSTVINKTITGSSYQLTSNLVAQEQYSWRVKAVGTYSSPWSEVRWFHVK